MKDGVRLMKRVLVALTVLRVPFRVGCRRVSSAPLQGSCGEIKKNFCCTADRYAAPCNRPSPESFISLQIEEALTMIHCAQSGGAGGTPGLIKWLVLMMGSALCTMHYARLTPPLFRFVEREISTPSSIFKIANCESPHRVAMKLRRLIVPPLCTTPFSLRLSPPSEPSAEGMCLRLSCYQGLGRHLPPPSRFDISKCNGARILHRVPLVPVQLSSLSVLGVW